MRRTGQVSALAVAWLLLRRISLRHWFTAWGTYCLLLLIVAVGVGSLNGIRQASRAASANFGLFNAAISGRTDFLIEAPAGALKAADLRRLGALGADPDWHLCPVVEGSLTLLSDAGEPLRSLRLVGLDLVAVGNLPHFIEEDYRFGQKDAQWYDWVGRADAVWISQGLVEEWGEAPRDDLMVAVSGQVHRLQVAGVLAGRSVPVPDDLALVDLPAAQALLQRVGVVDRVELVVEDRAAAADPEQLARLEARIREQLPDGFVLRAAGERVADRAAMTAAFRLNLMILSLIALLVAAYLILQALDAAVVRRRREIAILKSLGANARSVWWALMLEAALIGLLGSLAGVGLGYLLAAGAVGLLEDTVNALYFASSVEAIRLQASDWWMGLVLGFFFSLLAGWLPARDAMATPPAQVLARGDWSPGFRWLHSKRLGVAFVVIGLGLLWLPAWHLSGGGRLPVGAFLTAGCWILAGAQLSGVCLVGLAQLLRRWGAGAVGRLALARLAEGSSRHRLAVAGLVVAVSMVTGMLQLVGSFRDTIERWFDVRFQAQLYVSERGVGNAAERNGIAVEVVETLESHADVMYSDSYYVCETRSEGLYTLLAGADLDAWTDGRVEQVWYAPPGALSLVVDAEPALVSEAFARRFDVLDGGVVEVATPSGLRRVSPLGIYADYGNEFGAAVVAKDVWREWTGLDRPLNMSLFLGSGVAVNELRDELRMRYPGLDIRNGVELRTVALEIFDETFRVTAVLNWIGVTVAMAGLVLGLCALFAESRGSWLALRKLGFGRRRFMWVAGLESAGIALAAWVSGTVTGLALGWLLVHVINVQSFGWTLLWQVPLWRLLGFGGVLIATAYLSGVLVANWWYRRELGVPHSS